MSKLIKSDSDYSSWITDIKDRYRISQIKASVKVNQELLRFYWSLGRDIVKRDAENRYGKGFYSNLSNDLSHILPESKGFSRVNLQYMKRFYLLYNELSVNCPQVVDNSDEVIFWGSAIFPWHSLLDFKFENLSEALLRL